MCITYEDYVSGGSIPNFIKRGGLFLKSKNILKIITRKNIKYISLGIAIDNYS